MLTGSKDASELLYPDKSVYSDFKELVCVMETFGNYFYLLLL